jgi:GxxExxY protein
LFEPPSRQGAEIFMETPRGLPGRKEPSAELDQLAHTVIGSAITVHRALGAGYIESVYEEAMCVELDFQNIPYNRKYKIAVQYSGRSIGEGRLDLLIADALPVELKAVEMLAPIHQAQLLSYLKMTGFQLGLLINFNVPVLKQGIKRVILTV